jgi:hypothetical protein
MRSYMTYGKTVWNLACCIGSRLESVSGSDWAKEGSSSDSRSLSEVFRAASLVFSFPVSPAMMVGG